MPYICLTRSDIPDGVIQVLDMAPNSSQAIPSLSPPGETRYVNRVKTGGARIMSDGTLEGTHLDGLGAYILDNVEPGGLQSANGSITILAGSAAADTVTIGGVVFTCTAGAATAANQEFRCVAGTGSAAATATSLRATLVHAASLALMQASVVGGKPVGSYVAAAVPIGAAIALTARSTVGGDHLLVGWGSSALSLACSDATHYTLAPSGGRLTRGMEIWTPALLATAEAALIARLDAGSVLTLAGCNTALATVAPMELTSAGGSSSRGSVAGILNCLAGRTYRIARSTLTGAANQYMDATYPTFKMNQSSPLGGFTELVRVNGNVMQDGEIKPATIGGDIIAREVAGIRHSYNVDAITASLLGGQLKSMTGPTELWPNSEIVPRFPWDQAGFLSYDATLASRLLVVYDDDGTVLS